MDCTPVRSVREKDHMEPARASPSPSPSSRLWRPAAQRNLRNQWSRLAAAKVKWLNSSSSGLSHAIELVNYHLSLMYLPAMDLGVIKDMPNIREMSSKKLASKLETCGRMLLCSYKDMIRSLSDMKDASNSMRCYAIVPDGSPIVQYSHRSDGATDSGDCGGISIFTICSVMDFETLANELVDMFVLELSLKRLIVLELLSISHKEDYNDPFSCRWMHDLYQGEFNELSALGLRSDEIIPLPQSWQTYISISDQSSRCPSRETLEVYLMAWKSNAKIWTSRVNEIFELVEDEMQLQLLRKLMIFGTPIQMVIPDIFTRNRMNC